ncbi:HlyD family type I secretion periplasmic adaptor subunit [Shinella sp. DD12]|uniref:HlyD family type I secretion periplasmic adaptor subunit n=1 Tax=Shinella sp. DD12 TaxID=1410620 RepID=UPI000437A980|nr:HlyD family type I secretion periplasmic adaptor subunit [Shinella sp. DD12]EYR80474.1 membrane-fusion protein [Shinella sp. DD12]
MIKPEKSLSVAETEKTGQIPETRNLSLSVGDTYRDWYAKVLPVPARSYRRLALFTVFFLGSFSAWAVMAPIGGATVVPGRLLADGYNLTINHRYPGTILEIAVREGDKVKAGDVLAQIDSTESLTNLEIQSMRLSTADIRLARYKAEETDQNTFTLPPDLIKRIADNPSLASALESQRTELQARQEEKYSTVQIMDQRIATEKQSLSDLETVLAERRKRIDSVQKEIEVSDKLMEQGLTTRDRNFNLKRQISVDQEQLETLMTQVAERRSRLAQLQEDSLRWQAQRTTEISSQIVALNAEKAEALERVRYLKDMINKATIRAPQSGHIVRSYVNTVGASINGGAPLFDILPEAAAPIVEAHVTSRDIDIVEVGGELEVRIASQDRNRSMMFLEGKVTYVSYDAIPLGTPPQPVYVVRGKLNDDSIEKYGQIKPGTSAEVYFVTKPKNFVHYLLDPFLGIRDKAFTH